MAAELSQVGECYALPADCSTEEGCRGLADAVAEREPALHILVNNAGATWGAPLEPSTTTPAGTGSSTSTSRASSTSPSSCCPPLRAAATADDPARVINIGSIDGIHVPMLETYSLLVVEGGGAPADPPPRPAAWRRTVTVNAVAPGPFESKMMAATLAAFGDQIAGFGADEAHRPARRHGRRRHLPRVARPAPTSPARSSPSTAASPRPSEPHDATTRHESDPGGDGRAPARRRGRRRGADAPQEPRASPSAGCGCSRGARSRPDDGDVDADGEAVVARNAAVREAAEETGLVLAPTTWCPSPTGSRRARRRSGSPRGSSSPRCRRARPTWSSTAARSVTTCGRHPPPRSPATPPARSSWSHRRG